MKKSILVLSLAMLVSGAYAGKKSSKRNGAEAAAPTTEHVVAKKKQPLRNIARETSKGHVLTGREQAVFLEEDIEQTADDVGMIRYTITIFKDQDRYSMSDWDTTTRNTAQKFKNMNAQSSDWIEDVVEDIRASLIKAFDPNAPRSGVHAEVKVQMSSGARPTDCKCGDKCGCGTKYAGNCPCSLESPKAYPAELRVSCLDRKK